VVEDGFDATIRVGRRPECSLVARKRMTDRLIVRASRVYLARAGRPEAFIEGARGCCPSRSERIEARLCTG
jgi:hypothetical protein